MTNITLRNYFIFFNIIFNLILLCEIIENRFQIMHKKFGFSPRKCNSASMLSGCVQRSKSKVIIALPTCNEHVMKYLKKVFWVVLAV